jgi:phosphatidate cytidylyltransferase
MKTRLAISAVVLPIFTWLILSADPRPYLVVASLIALLGYWEYAGMMLKRGMRPARTLGVLWVAAYLLSLFPPEMLPGPLARLSALDAQWMAAGLLLSLAWYHVLRGDVREGLPALAADFFGVLYIAVLCGFFLRLQLIPGQGRWWSLTLFFTVWMYDAGAYFVGRTLGRTPLSPLSPKKTWEGLVGGVLIGVALAAAILPVWLPADFPLGRGGIMALAASAALFAQVGDLIESMLKRWAGVKDSSALFKELGGFLDKLDSPMFTAPLIYWVAQHWR